MPERPTLIAGNWKMYKTIEESEAFIRDLAPKIEDAQSLVYLGVPFTAIRPASEAAEGTKIVIGAQNMNDAAEGAFTGEIAGKMLVEAGAKFVIIGHSERRQLFGETDASVNLKIKRAIEEGLQVLFCIGETLEERESDQTEEVLERQITEGLQGVAKGKLKHLVLAYEPVWAIGTGKTATPEQAEQAHSFSRSVLEKIAGKEVAQKALILYGGSVKPANVKELMEQKDIDGALVGGASLTVESFNQIVNYQKNKASV